jgi:hypothetical protein
MTGTIAHDIRYVMEARLKTPDPLAPRCRRGRKSNAWSMLGAIEHDIRYGIEAWLKTSDPELHLPVQRLQVPAEMVGQQFRIGIGVRI